MSPSHGGQYDRRWVYLQRRRFSHPTTLLEVITMTVAIIQRAFIFKSSCPDHIPLCETSATPVSHAVDWRDWIINFFTLFFLRHFIKHRFHPNSALAPNRFRILIIHNSLSVISIYPHHHIWEWFRVHSPSPCFTFIENIITLLSAIHEVFLPINILTAMLWNRDRIGLSFLPYDPFLTNTQAKIKPINWLFLAIFVISGLERVSRLPCPWAKMKKSIESMSRWFVQDSCHIRV